MIFNRNLVAWFFSIGPDAREINAFFKYKRKDEIVCEKIAREVIGSKQLK